MTSGASSGAAPRWWRRPGGLRFRITALAVLAVLVVLTLAGLGLVLTQRAILTDALDQTLGDRADALARQLDAGGTIESRQLPGDDVLVQVVDDAGDVLAGSPGLTHVRRWPPAPATTTVTDGAFPGGGEARVLSKRVDDVSVHVVGSLEDVAHSAQTLVRSLAVAVPCSAVVLGAVVWWLVGRVLRPVEDIRAEVDRISASHLDRRVPEPDTADEVSRLAHTMNAMLDRLAGAAERQRRFVADAAHELRSPLARIRTELEVDRAHPALADPRASRETLLVEAIRLQALVDDLLLLARVDAGALHDPAGTPVDLDEVALSSAAAHRRAGSVVLDTSGVTPVQVVGDPAQLRRLVDNLLDNAVRHARDRVVVAVTEDGGGAVLRVQDDGPGIPAEAREAVFERFTRLDDARAQGDGGAGLGLAIARDVAERHGGRLSVEPGGPGARFELRLPVSSDPATRRMGRSVAG
jgi:signal transduction histidine kinase